MINKTVVAVAAVQGVELALRGAHEPRGEGTTPLPPSPFLAPTTF